LVILLTDEKDYTKKKDIICLINYLVSYGRPHPREGQIPQKAMEEIQSLFENGVDVKKTSEEKKLEEKFKPENFDLVTWFVVTGKK